MHGHRAAFEYFLPCGWLERLATNCNIVRYVAMREGVESFLILMGDALFGSQLAVSEHVILLGRKAAFLKAFAHQRLFDGFVRLDVSAQQLPTSVRAREYYLVWSG